MEDKVRELLERIRGQYKIKFVIHNSERSF